MIYYARSRNDSMKGREIRSSTHCQIHLLPSRRRDLDRHTYQRRLYHHRLPYQAPMRRYRLIILKQQPMQYYLLHQEGSLEPVSPLTSFESQTGGLFLCGSC